MHIIPALLRRKYSRKFRWGLIFERRIYLFLGPLETIKNNETGFLVNQTAVEFAQCMAKLVENQELYLKMKKKVCYRFF